MEYRPQRNRITCKSSSQNSIHLHHIHKTFPRTLRDQSRKPVRTHTTDTKSEHEAKKPLSQDSIQIKCMTPKLCNKLGSNCYFFLLIHMKGKKRIFQGDAWIT